MCTSHCQWQGAATHIGLCSYVSLAPPLRPAWHLLATFNADGITLTYQTNTNSAAILFLVLIFICLFQTPGLSNEKLTIMRAVNDHYRYINVFTY